MTTLSDATPPALARLVATALYGRQTVLEPFPGRRNAVFRLTTPAGIKVLKLAREAEAVSKELWIMRLLAERGLPVASVEHADAEGTTCGRPYFVMSSAGEETVADRIHRGTGGLKELAGEMGAVLGRIHEIGFPMAGDLRPGPAGSYRRIRMCF